MENEIKVWKDLAAEEQEKALKDDAYFDILTASFQGADFSERDRLLEKYNIELVCKSCEAQVNANFLKGLPSNCPQCHRVGLMIRGYDSEKPSPAFIADWLVKHYKFLTTEDQDAEIFIYDSGRGMWSAEKADATIEFEAKRILGERLKVQDINNIRLHVRALTYTKREVLKTAVAHSSGVKINLKNGTLHIAKEGAEFEEHNPNDYFIGVLPIEFNPQAEVPQRILQFLFKISGTSYDLITLLEGLAWPLLPGYPIQQALTLVGTGQNGKSTYLKLLTMLYGEENVADITLQQLSNAAKQQPFLLARLHGKLLNIADDLPAKPLEDIGFFKQLTGGSRIEAERKFGGRFGFVNSAKFFFAANQMPAVNEDSIAYWRRFCFVEFTKRIENPAPQEEILQEFWEELPGLFNLLVALIWPQLDGKTTFTFAASPEETQATYQKNSNSAQLFFQTMLEYNADSELLKADILVQYRNWCLTNNYIEVSDKKFWQTLRDEYPQVDERQVSREGKRIRSMVGIGWTEPNQENKNEDSKKILEKERKLDDYIANLHMLHNIHNFFPLIKKIKDSIEYILNKGKKTCIPCNTCTDFDSIKMEESASNSPENKQHPQQSPAPSPPNNALYKKRDSLHKQAVAFFAAQKEREADYTDFLATLPEEDRDAGAKMINYMWMTSGELEQVHPNIFRLVKEAMYDPAEPPEPPSDDVDPEAYGFGGD